MMSIFFYTCAFIKSHTLIKQNKMLFVFCVSFDHASHSNYISKIVFHTSSYHKSIVMVAAIMQMLIIIFNYIENLYSCPQIISLCYGER